MLRGTSSATGWGMSSASASCTSSRGWSSCMYAPTLTSWCSSCDVRSSLTLNATCRRRVWATHHCVRGHPG